MNAAFGESLHCVAAEPDATFVRFSVADRGREVAYESAVLGRLRRGYRVLLLRLPKTGTRIELCYLFVRISFRSEANVGAKVMHGPSVQVHSNSLADENTRLKQEIASLRSSSCRASDVGLRAEEVEPSQSGDTASNLCP